MAAGGDSGLVCPATRARECPKAGGPGRAPLEAERAAAEEDGRSRGAGALQAELASSPKGPAFLAAGEAGTGVDGATARGRIWGEVVRTSLQECTQWRSGSYAADSLDFLDVVAG